MLPIQSSYKRPSLDSTLGYLRDADSVAYNWWKNVGSKNPFAVSFASEMPFVGTYLRAHESAERISDYEKDYGIPFSEAKYPISAMYNMGLGYFANSGRSAFYDMKKRYRRYKTRRFVRRMYGFRY